MHEPTAPVEDVGLGPPGADPLLGSDWDRRDVVSRLLKLGAVSLALAVSSGGAMAAATSALAADNGTKSKHRYGMVIDTRRCVGCDACVVACKQENKTPPGVSYTVVLENGFGERPDDRPLFMTKPCFHCEHPPACRSAR
jgi:ferredoxin